MAGVPGRSGRRPRPLVEHIGIGSYRRDRHGPLPAVLPVPHRSSDWQPQPEDVAHLQEAGRRFLAALQAQFELSALEGRLVIEAASCLDNLTSWRREAAFDPKAAKLTIAHQRALTTILAQLRVMA